MLTLIAFFTTTIGAAEPDAEQLKFFEMKVRPLLVEQCFTCHAADKHKGGLRLDSLEAILKGGDTGPAVVPGKPEDSLLIKAILYTDDELLMPPKEKLTGKGGKMPAADIQTLTQWVKMGAPFPKGGKIVAEKKQKQIGAEDRAFWSFQPLKNPPLPAVKNAAWPKNPIDQFVLSKLEAEQLAPAGEAQRTALIRRVYFDLIGLPPAPQEVDEFVADASRDAYEKLIDKLLASPRYGEKWARHWLDLVRYAESDGFKQDAYRPNAWPYRDYVVKAFNEDKPYDRFVQEQIAGDEIAPNDPNVLVATGFMRHGMYEYNQKDAAKQWSEILNDITDTTGDVFLGLSMGCARCHDHKFDPILQADYFQLQAFFSPILMRDDLTLSTPAQKSEYDAKMKSWEEKTKTIRDQIAEIEKNFYRNAEAALIKRFPPEIFEMLKKPAEQRSPLEQQYKDLAYRQLETNVDGKIKGDARAKWTALKLQLAEFDDIKPKPLPPALAVTDVGPVAPPTFIFGDKQKRTFEPGFLTVLSSLNPGAPKIEPQKTSTGRRTALAKWLTRPDHPLTTRVIANRIWQFHFGRGIVPTSSDYGHLGEKPSHPELLDWLATRFVADGWSFKKMHRLIMTSATYRQAALRETPAVAKIKDPENRWLWKMSTRRLEGDQIRDSLLSLSGELSLNEGGPAADPTGVRRSIYTKVIRNARDPFLEAFDAPDFITSSASRSVTTTATQALLMINGIWPLQRAEKFANRLRQYKSNPNELITQAYKLAFGRLPDDKERAAAAAFLSKSTEPVVAGAPLAALGAPVTATMPHVGGQAAIFNNGSPDDFLRLADSPTLPSADFTIEAIVQLETIYDNAAVRVIASQWNGKQDQPGWSFGVTSEKSKHQPRNLILQLVGDASKGGGGYEVIASDLRLELHKPHYVAVSVKIKDTTDAGVTFYMRELSDPDAPLKIANVKHRVTGHYRSTVPLIIGGRDGAAVMGWDGLIDEVRIANVALSRERLLLNEPDSRDGIVANWRFEPDKGVFKDSAKYQADLAHNASNKPGAEPVKSDVGLIDFCHVLMNANEFLYTD